jgi:hypothetical protein
MLFSMHADFIPFFEDLFAAFGSEIGRGVDMDGVEQPERFSGGLGEPCGPAEGVGRAIAEVDGADHRFKGRRDHKRSLHLEDAPEKAP